MPRASREELARQLGLDIDDEASDFCLCLRMSLRTQRDEDINACDSNGSFTNYTCAAGEMYLWAFGPASIKGVYHDQKRKTIWFFRRKPPQDLNGLSPEIRMIYSVRQNNRYLRVYAGEPHGPSQRILTYDMQSPRDRQKFLYVRSKAAEKRPLPIMPGTILRKDLLKVQQRLQVGKSRRQHKEKKRVQSSMNPTDGGMGDETENRDCENSQRMELDQNPTTEGDSGNIDDQEGMMVGEDGGSVSGLGQMMANQLKMA